MTICGGVGNLKWREGIFFLNLFHPTLHLHMALLGNNGDWQRRNEVRWRSCHRQRKKEKPSCQRPQKNNTKYVREKFRIVYLPSLSSLMNEFLVARLCSAHLFIKIEKCVNAIHHSIWREYSLILFQTKNSPHWEIRYLRPDELHLRIFLKFGHNLERIEKVYTTYTISVYKGSQLPPKNKSWTFSSTFYITWFRIFFVWSW